MRIFTLPTAQSARGFDFSNSVVVVIDVLRATTVITNALENGASACFTVPTTADAFLLKSSLPASRCILGGERDALPIDGFDLGNSPQDYTPVVVRGKYVVLTTTNGTQAINNCLGTRRLFAASLRNCTATAEAVASCILQSHPHPDLVIVCAGTNANFSLEDSVCAGHIVNAVMPSLSNCLSSVCDLSRAASLLAISNSAAPCLSSGVHAQRLLALGFHADLRFSLMNDDVSRLVAVFDSGRFVTLGTALS